MWELLASYDAPAPAVTGTDVGAVDLLIESIASQVANEYAVPRDRVRNNVECFLRGARRRRTGRLDMRAMTRRADSYNVPSLLACTVRIFRVKVMLRLLGFDRTWSIVCVHAEPRTEGRREIGLEHRAGSERPFHELIEYRVALASALYPGRALCLERSLVLYHYLRRAGVSVRLRLGVQPYPFAAHAWVELEGKPLNNVPEHVGHFTPVDSFIGRSRAGVAR